MNEINAASRQEASGKQAAETPRARRWGKSRGLDAHPSLNEYLEVGGLTPWIHLARALPCGYTVCLYARARRSQSNIQSFQSPRFAAACSQRRAVAVRFIASRIPLRLRLRSGSYVYVYAFPWRHIYAEYICSVHPPIARLPLSPSPARCTFAPRGQRVTDK